MLKTQAQMHTFKPYARKYMLSDRKQSDTRNKKLMKDVIKHLKHPT